MRNLPPSHPQEPEEAGRAPQRNRLDFRHRASHSPLRHQGVVGLFPPSHLARQPCLPALRQAHRHPGEGRRRGLPREGRARRGAHWQRQDAGVLRAAGRLAAEASRGGGREMAGARGGDFADARAGAADAARADAAVRGQWSEVSGGGVSEPQDRQSGGRTGHPQAAAPAGPAPRGDRGHAGPVGVVRCDEP